jgi:hypothetical protein
VAAPLVEATPPDFLPCDMTGAGRGAALSAGSAQAAAASSEAMAAGPLHKWCAGGSGA